MKKEISYEDYKNMTVGPKKQKRRPFYANKKPDNKMPKITPPKIYKPKEMPKEMGPVSKYYNKGGYVITGR